MTDSKEKVTSYHKYNIYLLPLIIVAAIAIAAFFLLKQINILKQENNKAISLMDKVLKTDNANIVKSALRYDALVDINKFINLNLEQQNHSLYLLQQYENLFPIINIQRIMFLLENQIDNEGILKLLETNIFNHENETSSYLYGLVSRKKIHDYNIDNYYKLLVFCIRQQDYIKAKTLLDSMPNFKNQYTSIYQAISIKAEITENISNIKRVILND